MTESAEEGARPPWSCFGHEEVFQRFRRILERGRLASTYLFVGDRGVGKRAAAGRLAAALLCPQSDPTTLTPCGGCRACGLLSAGNHPDLLAVERPEGKATLPVDLLIGEGDKRNRQGLCHDLALKPLLGPRRIAIIDDADHLGVEGANCLLKTLEEPPPGSVIFLIATSPSRVLPTIRSRSQVVRFAPLDEGTVARVLRQIGAAEDDERAARLAAASRGCVSRALAADDPELNAIGAPLHEALAGVDFDPVALTAAVQELISGSAADAATRRRRLAAVIDQAIAALRVALRKEGRPVDAVIAQLEVCVDAQQHLESNANQALLVQWWIDRLWRSAPARG